MVQFITIKHSMKDQYIYGTRAILEAIEAGKEIEKILIKKGLDNDLFSQLKQKIKERNIPVQFVPIEKINRISKKNHQGCLAIVSPIEYQSIEDIVPLVYEKGETPLFLILDRVTDVRNFGAIARTAHCASVHAIIIPAKGSASINSDAMKTSAGALHSIAICREQNLKSCMQYLKNSGIKMLACTEKTETLIYDAEFNHPLAIVMGSEDEGISMELMRLCDENVKIPMYGNIESLNVSVATGVILYECIRQRLL